MKVKLAWTINNLWPSHHYFILTVWSCPYSSCYTSSILFYIDPVKPDIFYPKTTNDSSVSAAGQKSNWSSQIGYVSFNHFTSPMIYEKNISKFMLFSADYRCHSIYSLTWTSCLSVSSSNLISFSLAILSLSASFLDSSLETSICFIFFCKYSNTITQ